MSQDNVWLAGRRQLTEAFRGFAQTRRRLARLSLPRPRRSAKLAVDHDLERTQHPKVNPESTPRFLHSGAISARHLIERILPNTGRRRRRWTLPKSCTARD
jgi:hypothetical protein